MSDTKKKVSNRKSKNRKKITGGNLALYFYVALFSIIFIINTIDIVITARDLKEARRIDAGPEVIDVMQDEKFSLFYGYDLIDEKDLVQSGNVSNFFLIKLYYIIGYNLLILIIIYSIYKMKNSISYYDFVELKKNKVVLTEKKLFKAQSIKHLENICNYLAYAIFPTVAVYVFGLILAYILNVYPLRSFGLLTITMVIQIFLYILVKTVKFVINQAKNN